MSNELVAANLKAKTVKMKNDRLEGTYVDEYEAVGGLKLRDYFAAKEMQSQLSQIDVDLDVNYDAVAREAYLAADAMMRLRIRELQSEDLSKARKRAWH